MRNIDNSVIRVQRKEWLMNAGDHGRVCGLGGWDLCRVLKDWFNFLKWCLYWSKWHTY